MKLTDLHVVVAGAATAGAAAALLAARAGARVTLVEKVAEPRPVGAALALAANGLAVLESLGLGPALAPHLVLVPSPKVLDARGRALFTPPGDAPELGLVHRAALQRVLLDAVSAEPRIERRFGAEVVSARSDGALTVRVGAEREELRGDLVVGADGVRSAVRAHGDFGARVEEPGITYLRAMVGPGRAENAEAWTACGLFGSFAVPGATYVYASAASPRARRALADRDLGALRRAWADAYPPAAHILGEVASFDDLLVNRVVRVHAARWSDGALVLAGDAAHAMAPNLGQGANSALVDAAVLIDELERAPAIPAALAAYEARRRPRVKRVADTAARLGGLAEVTGPVLRALRDRLLMPLAGALTPKMMIDEVLQEPREVLLAIGRRTRATELQLADFS